MNLDHTSRRPHQVLATLELRSRMAGIEPGQVCLSNRVQQKPAHLDAIHPNVGDLRRERLANQIRMIMTVRWLRRDFAELNFSNDFRSNRDRVHGRPRGRLDTNLKESETILAKENTAFRHSPGPGTSAARFQMDFSTDINLIAKPKINSAMF